ncbi:carboxymuconolactone decarboxylase family protein [uncultured Chitinophaga sp.]|uniref:carboxymuconolactone decarboxylase family protein n=1 Tax=uncultured Chitinophaga sp. TaxID=339340 RepID=UPI0025DBA79B|nr:carboxymuconolactone decarboxylase family protein [uncultured Chitinophaga sp.]
MENRVKINEAHPAAYKAMYALEAALATSSLTKNQKELIKIRASQINACAFCIDMHTKDAIKNGETTQRIFLLNAWRETDLFSAEEKAILAVTEEVTLIHQHGLTAATYQAISRYFSEEVIAQIIMAVVAINAWNRIAISSLTPVPR